MTIPKLFLRLAAAATLTGGVWEVTLSTLQGSSAGVAIAQPGLSGTAHPFPILQHE